MSPTPWRHERRAINCCKGCVAPKRHPGCSDRCEEYKQEKAKHLAAKERERKEKELYPVLTHYDFNRL